MMSLAIHGHTDDDDECNLSVGVLGRTDLGLEWDGGVEPAVLVARQVDGVALSSSLNINFTSLVIFN